MVKQKSKRIKRKSTHSTPRAKARGMLRVDTERRFLPRFENRGLAPSNVSTDKKKEKSIEKTVEFTFRAPEAREVFLAGEFNGWDIQSLPMKKSKDGVWSKKIKLTPGRLNTSSLRTTPGLKVFPEWNKFPIC